MDASRVFDLRSDPSCDVISLETNRRVSAVLHCDEIPQLLLLNGGSESEQLHVDVIIPAVREPLCFGSHEVEPGKYVIVDLPRATRSVRMRVRVIGGPSPMALDEPPAPFRIPVARLASAAALAIGFGSLVLLPGVLPPAKKTALPTPTPVAIAAPRPHLKHRPRPVAATKAPVIASAPVQPPIVVQRAEPAPVVAVSTPSLHIVNGDPIAISFDSNGAQVHIVSKIGPRTIDDRIIGASHGKLLLKPPRSSSVRVLTINASVRNDGAMSSRRAIVILLPDIPTPPVTNL